MPINAYTGLMGSGKSYECVSTVIVDAVAAGRRVVTNVDGIDSDEVRIFAHEKTGKKLDQLGHVVHCTNDDVLKADFLPHGANVDTLVKGGDLVCIDEAWRFWGADSKIPNEHFIFFREHRHYVDPDTKTACDLALMVQDISDLHRKVKYVVEMTIRTTKLKSLGLNKTYRVEIWEGYKTLQRLKVKTEVKKYDPRIFALYSSYAGGSGKELVMDTRQNILNSKKLWFGCLALVVVGYIAVTNTIKFFSPAKPLDGKGNAGAASHSLNAGQTNAAPAAVAAQQPSPFSSEWRVIGHFKGASGPWVVVQDSKGRTRLESPTVFNEPDSILAIGTIDGQRVSAFSGAATAKEAAK